MTAILTKSFKALFPLLVGLLVLGVMIGAARMYLDGRDPLLVLAVAVGGLLCIVAVFGAVALQIENNILLNRIAKAIERPATSPFAQPGVTSKGGSLRAVAAQRNEPPVRRG